jgi:hypothetical protein
VAKEFTKNFTDINYFTDPYEDIDFVDENFVVLAENVNLFTSVFSKEVLFNFSLENKKFISTIRKSN